MTSSTTRFRRIKDIYLRFADQAVGRRERLILEECGDDHRLAADVLGLFALADAPTGTLGVVDRIAGGTTPEVGPTLRAEDADELLASLEGWERFTDLQLIGSGGMGVVFRAYDPRLKRCVALKFLSRLSARATARFRREAELQARVDHDNVLDVYETGDVAGRPFLAMRLVEGVGLSSVRAETSLTVKLDLMRQIAEAVHAAHGLGLIHRDLKPSNILVERTPQGLKPWVTDFGIAADLGGPALTSSFLALGSPRYMAPEQLDEGAVLGPRTDIYGLGATFYELLTGAPTFGDRSIVDLLIKVRNESVLPLEQVAPEVPPDVASVVMRCLEKDPACRYATAGGLAADLERLLGDLSTGDQLAGERRVGERRTGERRTGERRIQERRTGDRRVATSPMAETPRQVEVVTRAAGSCRRRGAGRNLAAVSALALLALATTSVVQAVWARQPNLR